MATNYSGPGVVLNPGPAVSAATVRENAGSLTRLPKTQMTTGEAISLTKEIPANLANPLSCPTCGEETDWIADVRSNNRTIAEANTCGKCGTRWMNFYIMSRQVILGKDEPLPDDIEDEFESDDDLCAWCRCELGGSYVISEATGTAKFCTESDLYEALMQSIDKEVEIVPGHEDHDDDLLECPHCHKQSFSIRDRWGSEGMFTVPGPDGFSFSIMTCPHCGGIAPYTESVMVPANDPRLESIIHKYHKSRFQIEDGPLFEGYTDGKHWNGWAQPLFTKEQAELLAKWMSNRGDGCKLWYNQVEDAFKYFYGDDCKIPCLGNSDMVDTFPGITTTVDEREFECKRLQLYPIGAGCWCWDEEKR